MDVRAMRRSGVYGAVVADWGVCRTGVFVGDGGIASIREFRPHTQIRHFTEGGRTGQRNDFLPIRNTCAISLKPTYLPEHEEPR